MKFRGYQIDLPRDFPFPSFPLLFLLFPIKCDSKTHGVATLTALAHCLHLSRWPGALIWPRSLANATSTEASCCPWMSSGQRQQVATLTPDPVYCFPPGQK